MIYENVSLFLHKAVVEFTNHIAMSEKLEEMIKEVIKK